MIQLYNVNYIKLEGLTNYKDLNVQREVNQLDILSFLFPVSDPKYGLIQEECYIRTKENEYVVKEVNSSDDDWTQYVCKVNIEGIKGMPVSHFEAVEQLCADGVNLALAGTGWIIGSCDVTKKRTVKKNNCNAYDVLQEIQSAYGCEMTFDSINKKVYIYQSMGSDKGTYFAEQLNLKKLDKQSNSYDYITRLIIIGKDGLDVTSVNGGKNYIENYQYSNKVITAYWEDNRYTVPTDLLEDGITRLDYLSKPLKAYKADVYDLANSSEEYKDIIDYALGDTITLLSRRKNIKEKQRIIKLTEYLEEPEKNSCEIANKLARLEDLNVRFIDTSETLDNVTNSDGTVDGNKVDSIDFDKIEHVHIQTADIEDGSITNVKIGNGQITEANITNGAITTAKIENASITAAKIAEGCITDALIENGAIKTAQIADGSITDAKIVSMSANRITAGTINADDIEVINLHADNITVGTINGNQISDGAIDTKQIANGAITAEKIPIGTITEAQVNWKTHLLF